MIALFAYDFPHRKSQDFIIELAVQLGKNFCVLAAPSKHLQVDRDFYYNQSLKLASPLSTKDLCQALGVIYCEVEHENYARLSELQVKHGFSRGIIAGARIIPSEIIELFKDGIVNFHPGAIPETSGLDAFYYTILKNVSAGITVHFIDARVDAGELIFFAPLVIGPDDIPEIVNFNNYQLQISALRRLLNMLKEGSIKTEVLRRPKKNPPMSPAEKNLTLKRFSAWRAEQYFLQKQMAFHQACEDGELEKIRAYITASPFLLESRTPEGWTPLILAAYNQHKPIVEYFLKLGANPNATGNKGTNVLMYAKSRLLNQSAADLEIIKLLVNYGADLARCDMYGLTIFDYVREAGDQDLLNALEALKN